MVRGLATKPARIGSDKIYLSKARDFLEGARTLAEKEKWNSSAVLSVHAVRKIRFSTVYTRMAKPCVDAPSRGATLG
jgi:hypothetical protein